MPAMGMAEMNTGRSGPDHLHEVFREIFIHLQGRAGEAKDDHLFAALLVNLFGVLQGALRGNGIVKRLGAVFDHDIDLGDLILEFETSPHAGNHRVGFGNLGNSLDVRPGSAAHRQRRRCHHIRKALFHLQKSC